MDVDTFVMTLIVAIVIGTISGFITGVVAEQILERAKVHRYPGGSLVAGLIAGLLVFPNGVVFVIISLVYGVVGWLLYKHFLPINKEV